MDLKNTVVLVTGSSVGIGASIAKEFAKAGAKIVVTYDTNKDKAFAVSQECEKLGASGVLVTKLDVCENDDIVRVVKETVEKFGQIDILVNNAGVFVDGTVESTDFSGLEKQIRVNVEGLIKMTHQALPYTKAAIVNIASRAGLVAYHPYSTYGASKWAVRGFSKALAGETDIPVYVVNPTGTATAMNDFQGDPPEKVARIVVDVVSGKLRAKSGDDINIWEH